MTWIVSYRDKCMVSYGWCHMDGVIWSPLILISSSLSRRSMTWIVFYRDKCMVSYRIPSDTVSGRVLQTPSLHCPFDITNNVFLNSAYDKILYLFDVFQFSGIDVFVTTTQHFLCYFLHGCQSFMRCH